MIFAIIEIVLTDNSSNSTFSDPSLSDPLLSDPLLSDSLLSDPLFSDFALSSPSPARMHLGYVDGLRAVAAVVVILCHSWLEVWPGGIIGSPVWTHWLNFGHVAVDMFIVLSGFCLMLPVVRAGGTLRGGAFTFFHKRARRILPPYYFATVFSLLLIWTLIGKPTGTHWDISLPVTAHTILVHLLLLQDFAPQHLYKINHAFWSISLEWWIYFLFPLLVLTSKRFGGAWATGLSLAVTCLLCRFCDHVFGQSFTLQYIALFSFGMLGAEIVQGHQSPLRVLPDRLPWGAITWAAFGVAWLALEGKLPHFVQQEESDLLVGFWAVSLLVTLGLRKNLLSRLLAHKFVVFLGSFAYSIYLIHAPLLQVLWQYLLRPMNLDLTSTFFILVLLGTPLIIGLAYLFHLAFERPFMTKSGVKIKNEAQSEVAAIISPAP